LDIKQRISKKKQNNCYTLPGRAGKNVGVPEEEINGYIRELIGTHELALTNRARWRLRRRWDI
jgi:hypothetical protein